MYNTVTAEAATTSVLVKGCFKKCLFGVGDVVPVIECLSRKYKALRSNTNTASKKSVYLHLSEGA
jgi:hypothetical protein